MIDVVEKFLKKYNIYSKTVLVGFSAGPDSCALALVLNFLKEKYKLNIILAYFNHGWREEAVSEEEFTKKFAKKISAAFYIEKANENVLKTELAARDLRYEFFKKTAKNFNADVVFLAHNKNDNVETLIYRVIKGTSIKGLCAIPEKRDIFFRPLLEVNKKDILDFLKKHNQEFMVDSSNDDIKYKRNLIRKKILPLFEDINPNYIENISNLIENSINSTNIINECVNDIKNKIIKDSVISYLDFIALKKELRYEILNNYLGDKLKYRDFKTIKKIDDFILSNKNSKISIGLNIFLKIKNDEIFIETQKEKNTNEIIINDIGCYNFEGHVLKIEKSSGKIPVFPKSNEMTCYLNFNFPIILRHRKPGDIFFPCGSFGKKKLKDFLIDEKIDQIIKDELFLLCDNNEVCWIIGLRMSEKYKIKNPCYYKLTWE